MRTDERAAAREAFARQEWRTAFAGLAGAGEAAAHLDVEDLKRLAVAAYMLGRDEQSAALWARAHAKALTGHDVRRAARCAFWLVLDLLTRGETARAGGWLARAQHFLDEQPHPCPEQGLLLALTARTHVRAGDIDSAREAATEAIALAGRFDDPELQVFSRLCLAQVLARRGERSRATALFDEIMVAVTVDGVSPVGIGVTYCAVIEGCFALLDLGRAHEWTEALAGWCAAQPDMVPFRGACLVHRAELLRLHGDWAEAEAEAEAACRCVTDAFGNQDAGSRASTFKVPAGAAFYQVAEIHRLRGAFDRADAAYRQASEYGHTPVPGLPLLRFAQGRQAVAEAAIRRTLDERLPPPRRAAVLAACAEIMTHASSSDTAREAADELARMAETYEAPFLRALAAHAMGRVLLARGDARGALRTLREAWMHWQAIEAPCEAARVRVLLALTCRALGDDDAARLELDAAEHVFERLGAGPDLARVRSLRAAPFSPDPEPLTPRERQVLALVATGITNRAIADALDISDRTVDRHVSNILGKLDLPSRAAAAAYAVERGVTPRT